MGSQAIHEAKPVFIVGSPRSGTSILTWALGQHPNLLPTEESNWLGSFAIYAAAAYVQGSERAQRSQLSALGIGRDDFVAGLGDAIDHMILASSAELASVSGEDALNPPQQINPKFAIPHDSREGKSRWVDGTPEYSLQIPALLALFPKARFVHILRDADQVAASLLAFRDELNRQLVGSVEEAYAYWRRMARACLDAEEILGPEVVHRVRHADLVADGERVLRGILEFLEEPFAPACLDPLKHRINSSFAKGTRPHTYPSVRSAVIEEARDASAKWLASPQPTSADPQELARWQAEFDTSVLHALRLQTTGEISHRMLLRLRLMIGVCGLLLLGNGLLALAFWLRSGDAMAAHWLALACAMGVVYLWLRRTGLRSIATRMFGMVARSIGKPR